MPFLLVGERRDWPTLGWDAIDWIERHCVHGPGDVQGDQLVLDEEEVDLLLDLYRLYPPDHRRAGRRVVSRGRYSRSKGRRKSELAGTLVCWEAFGACRFERWDSNGYPIGRRVQSPFIRVLATEEGQTGNTYDNVRTMIEAGLERGDAAFAGALPALTATRILGRYGGEIRPSTASSASKDGGKETFVVADEIHLYVLPELRAMHRTVSRNLVKRKIAEPWMFETTTAFRPGQKSVAESGHTHALLVAEGRARDAGLYVNHREGHEVPDWKNDEEILRSLEEAYGDAAAWMDLERILTEEIRGPEAEEPDSRRYFLNQVRKAGDAAFDLERWHELGWQSRVVAPTAMITLGFDGSRSQDSTGLVATEILTGHQFVMGAWERPIGVDDWQVPLEQVDHAVTDAFARFTVWRFYADPPHFEDQIALWKGRFGKERVHEWATYRTRPMAYALKAWKTAQTAGELSHDGNEILTRHVGNARLRDTRIRDDETDQFLWTIGKEHAKSPFKIDLAMAACLSWTARRDAIALGVHLQRQPSKKLRTR